MWNLYGKKYKMSTIKFDSLLKIIYPFFIMINPRPQKNTDNIVVFNKYHEKKIRNKNLRFYYGYVPSLDSNYTINRNVKKNNNVVYLGRLDDKQKNMKLLNKIANESEYNFNVFGDGPDKNMIVSQKAFVHGWIKNSDILMNNTILSSKVAIFTSKFEGCCVSMHDCVNLGIIPVTSNFSPEVKAIIPPELWDVLVIKKYNNIDEWNQKIDNIMQLPTKEYEQMLNQIIQHYHKTYKGGTQFIDAWKQIIEDVSKRKPNK